MGSDSTDSDVTPAVHKPIIAAVCHDVIDEHLPLSGQRSAAPRDVTVQEVAVKVEQRDSDETSTSKLIAIHRTIQMLLEVYFRHSSFETRHQTRTN